MNLSNLTRYVFFAITCLFIVFGCQKDIKETLPSIPTPQIPDKTVLTGFQGRILDENGNPVEGALAKAGDKTALTDKYGIFRIEQVQISELFAFVSVEKAGYFKGSRTVAAKTEALNFIEIQLIPKKLSGNFAATSGAKIDLEENNASVTFQSGSIITKSGAAYSGNVNVYATSIDPSAENFTSIMPGDLRGIRTDSSVTAMISYGMITVTLTDDAGEELQLNKTKPATISMTIPAGLQASAPSEIPLWHFDETDGKWREEGKAVKKGNIYSGEVSHFSTWNYDVPQDFVFISLNIGGPDGSNSPYTQVKITDKQNGGYGTAFTDSLGNIYTWVPKNVALEISIINGCSDILLTKDVGPFNEKTDLGRIEVSSNKMVVISGNVINCDIAPVASGYVNLFVKGLLYRGDVIEGKFSIILSECKTDGSSAEIYAVDHETNKRGESHYFNLEAIDIDAGQLSSCGDEMPEEYAYFKLGDERHDLVITNDTSSFDRIGKTTYFWFTKFPYGNSNDTYLDINLADTIPFTFTSNLLSCAVGGEMYTPVEPVTITCTEYGKPGELVALNFSGEMSKDSTASGLPFSGAIRIKRRR